MKAEDAKQLVQDAKPTNMKAIYDAIKRVAETGKSDMFWYKEINELQKKELLDNGFDCENMSDWRDGVMYKISWN